MSKKLTNDGELLCTSKFIATNTSEAGPELIPKLVSVHVQSEAAEQII